MKRFLILAALPIVGCQPSSDAKNEATQASKIVAEDVAVRAGIVGLRLKAPVSEPYACIFPIQIENGLSNSTSVTMIRFKVLGPGDDANGNMFAPPAPAGEKSEARVIVEGQSCDAYDTLSIPEIRCTSGEDNCAAKVELIDGGGLRFARTG